MLYKRPALWVARILFTSSVSYFAVLLDAIIYNQITYFATSTRLSDVQDVEFQRKHTYKQPAAEIENHKIAFEKEKEMFLSLLSSES